ncbi:uncharacterized protein PITG_14036 [Phytophthora infestans T30-4]|uniref:Uncharacterized protein n=1 Tax=Phytophthora infestans (strain T30-4) TaxID=403677 RepID=D0NNH1_PHYIT|nr:uncharacterized protein PITG_14036 [Phytophthora infestans T30-4]EEY62142.1 conserved hypothetical protein [Phytophthora infestans T30-4]|eukprot:XP_002899173.1 conserved hypothetical protein [Phytophthora infestans T30-4]
MSFPILLNLNNQVATHQFRYRFSQPIDFSQYEIALGSISIYYSWRAITAQRQNNSFKIIWPTASTTTTYSITLPDGTYSASEINNYLQYFCIQNNLYLINNTTGQYYYFISCAENPSSYALQFTTAYTPQLQVDNAAFGTIIGFSPAIYPAAQTTSVYAVNSNLVPQIDPTAAVYYTHSRLLGLNMAV